jgi:FOG: WD40 repeat
MRFLWLAFLLVLVLALASIGFWWHRQATKSQLAFVPYKVINAHPSEPVYRITFSPDGQLLVTRGGADKTVKVWSVEDGQLLYEIHIALVPPPQPICFAFSPDGRLLAVGYADGAVRIFNAADGQLKRTLRNSPRVNWLGLIVFSPDGKLLAQTWDDFLIEDHRVFVWEVATGKLVRELKNSNQTMSLAFSPSGKQLVVAEPNFNFRTASIGLTLNFWDTKTWQKRTLNFASLLPSPLIGSRYETTAFLSDPQRFLMPLSYGNKVFVLRLHPPAVERVFTALNFPFALHPRAGIAWRSEFPYAVQKDMLAVVEKRGIPQQLYRLNMSLPDCPPFDKFKVRLERNLMRNLRRTDQVIRCYRLPDGKEVARIRQNAREGWIYSLALSPDSRYLAAGLDSGQVVIWTRVQ